MNGNYGVLILLDSFFLKSRVGSSANDWSVGEANSGHLAGFPRFGLDPNIFFSPPPGTERPDIFTECSIGRFVHGKEVDFLIEVPAPGTVPRGANSIPPLGDMGWVRLGFRRCLGGSWVFACGMSMGYGPGIQDRFKSV